MQRNQSEETLVELEFRTLDVSDVNLDNEFDDFLQHRKTSLKTTIEGLYDNLTFIILVKSTLHTTYF